jgi:type IV pilus biogenesis protein PilP
VVRTRKVAAAAPVRAVRQPSPQREPRLGRGAMSLIGVFGGANGRHALIQLPDGSTERVRAGDQFRGVQVTAVAADAVQVRVRGRETVLKLPE